ncbi:porin [Dongia sp.]|uniref:porin n=1 Tax=Dongia sp. TaxID=1977262 RepID=UPI0035AEB6B5
MKKVLLGTSALLGVGLLAGTAAASDGVKLSLGGFMRSYFGATFDDDDAGESGDNLNTTGVGTDAEVYFLGSVTLDNGITVGTRIELEAESRDNNNGEGNDNDQIDAAYAYFSGGFGEIRIGSLAGAAGNMYMLPPGSSANFGPYSPNTIGSAASPGLFDPEGALTNKDKSQKLVYYSPTWSGFSFGVSYTPEDNFETQQDGAEATFHPTRNTGDAANNVALGLHYAYEGDGWGLDAGAAGYWEGDIQQKNADAEDEQSGYNAGVNLSFGGLTVGAAFTYLDDQNGDNEDLWVVGTGLSYNVDAWTVGAGWAHLEQEEEGFGDNNTTDRLGVTGSYAMGPGIDLDAGIFYTWSDEADDSAANDDYDAIEFAIGSSITF